MLGFSENMHVIWAYAHQIELGRGGAANAFVESHLQGVSPGRIADIASMAHIIRFFIYLVPYLIGICWGGAYYVDLFCFDLLCWGAIPIWLISYRTYCADLFFFTKCRLITYVIHEMAPKCQRGKGYADLQSAHTELGRRT